MKLFKTAKPRTPKLCVDIELTVHVRLRFAQNTENQIR